MTPQRRILRSPGSIYSRPTNRSNPSAWGFLERSPVSFTTCPKATRVHPFLRATSGIGRFLGNGAIEHIHHFVHLLPELPSTRSERGPGCLQVLVTNVGRGIPDRPHITRD